MPTATHNVDAPITECPDCGGDLWDNRTTKRNAKQPDFRCKDRDDCGAAIWLKKKETNGKRGAQKEAHSMGGPLPGEEPVAETAEAKKERLGALGQLQVICAKIVRERTVPVLIAGTNPVGVSPESQAAMINTLFIAAERRGCA
jgi:hypothetical protein